MEEYNHMHPRELTVMADLISKISQTQQPSCIKSNSTTCACWQSSTIKQAGIISLPDNTGLLTIPMTMTKLPMKL